MTFSIKDLRKSRGSNFEAITKALTKPAGGFSDDEGFFKLERDKAGNASATIRFMPKHPDDELPWVQLYTHGFKGPTGRWYIENSRTTLGEEDPVSEMNRELWNSGSEANKKIARDRKRKTQYIANVLVIADPKHPENEGKVMHFKFGKKIFEKIMDKATPTFEDEKPVDVFDPDTGAEFKLRMRQVDGYPNYDKSEFSDPKPIGDSDDEINAVLGQIKPLKVFLDPSQFKSYDELAKKLNYTLSAPAKPGSLSPRQAADQMEEASAPAEKQAKAPRSVPEKAPAVDVPEEDGDTEEYFRSLAA